MFTAPILNCTNTSNNDNILSNKYILDKLKIYYPEIDPLTIDNDLLENIIYNIMNEDNLNTNENNLNINKIYDDIINNINNISENNNEETKHEHKCEHEHKCSHEQKINNFNKKLINQNILMADEIIPEMSLSTNLIYLNGKINGKDIRVMIDTGASSCVIFKSTMEKTGLDYLIDYSSTVLVQGAHGMKPTLGTIWFMELDLEVENKNDSGTINKNFVAIPITAEVIDDSDSIQATNIIKEHMDKINNIIATDEKVDDKKKNGFEIILGMTFLKSYRANIDFSTMIITLNKNIKIKFN